MGEAVGTAVVDVVAGILDVVLDTGVVSPHWKQLRSLA